MGQTQKISMNNTSIWYGVGFTSVTLHNTEIVRFSSLKIFLDSGGYQTHTTKTRMNQVSNQERLGYRVFQKDFEWFVDFRGETIPFKDGMVLER